MGPMCCISQCASTRVCHACMCLVVSLLDFFFLIFLRNLDAGRECVTCLRKLYLRLILIAVREECIDLPPHLSP